MNTTPLFRSTVVAVALMAVAVVAISATPTSALFIPLTASSSLARFYTTTNIATSVSLRQRLGVLDMAAEGNDDSSSSLSQGVVELADNDDDEEETVPGSSSSSSSSSTTGAVAPFLSQGEISEEAMEMDWKDPKQARVMFYIILSLIPVLFLIPLMLGSRDLIPIDALPPVEMN